MVAAYRNFACSRCCLYTCDCDGRPCHLLGAAIIGIMSQSEHRNPSYEKKTISIAHYTWTPGWKSDSNFIECDPLYAKIESYKRSDETRISSGPETSAELRQADVICSNRMGKTLVVSFREHCKGLLHLQRRAQWTHLSASRRDRQRQRDQRLGYPRARYVP